jgi:integrase
MEDLPPQGFEPRIGATQLTLADLLATLSTAVLPPKRLADLQSSVRTICRIVGRNPEHIPLDLPVIRRILKHEAPGTEGPSKKTLQNLRSNLGAAIKASGLKSLLRTAGQQLAPEWSAVLQAIGKKGPRTSLSRFSRFCSAKRIAPAAVDDAVFEEFRIHLELETLVYNPEKSLTKAIWGWNAACTTLPEFPGSPVTPRPIGRVAKRRSFAELPASFVADLEAHLAWAADTDPFDPDARGRKLKPRTVELRRDHVRSAVDIALNNGIAPHSLASLRDLVVVDVVRTIFRALHKKSDGRPSYLALMLAKTLISIAREWADASPEHIDELKRLRSKLPGFEAGLSKKNKQVLVRLDDPSVLEALLDLPGKIMSWALSDRCPGKRRLPMVQVALMLEFLLHIPLRISDLTKLRFGENISWPAGSKGPACLALTLEKTGTPYQGELDGELAAMLWAYREKLVPKLTGGHHKDLFISIDGRRKLPATLSVEFKTAMIEHLGFAITPHQMRHIAAKMILDRNPGAFEQVKQLLGHAALKTTVSFYAGLDTNRAVRHHDQLIREIRASRQLPRKKGRKTRDHE